MIQLRIEEHALKDGNMLEVWRDGRFIASVYAAENRDGRPEIKIVTKHGIGCTIEGDALTRTAIVVIREGSH